MIQARTHRITTSYSITQNHTGEHKKTLLPEPEQTSQEHRWDLTLRGLTMNLRLPATLRHRSGLGLRLDRTQ